MKYLVLLALVLMSSGCATTSKDYNGQVTCHSYLPGWEGQWCTVYDPTLKQQVPIDENGGVVNTCSTTTHTCTVYLFEKAQCYTCQATFTDSMGNSWTTPAYNEEVTPQ